MPVEKPIQFWNRNDDEPVLRNLVVVEYSVNFDGAAQSQYPESLLRAPMAATRLIWGCNRTGVKTSNYFGGVV